MEADPANGVCGVGEYVSSILSVLHEGDAPGITEVHAKRILTVPPYLGMDMAGLKLKTFDHVKVTFSAFVFTPHTCCSQPFWQVHVQRGGGSCCSQTFRQVHAQGGKPCCSLTLWRVHRSTTPSGGSSRG